MTRSRRGDVDHVPGSTRRTGSTRGSRSTGLLAVAAARSEDEIHEDERDDERGAGTACHDSDEDDKPSECFHLSLSRKLVN